MTKPDTSFVDHKPVRVRKIARGYDNQPISTWVDATLLGYEDGYPVVKYADGKLHKLNSNKDLLE